MKKINLLFAVHNHQPLDNFASVYEEGWEHCYAPFLEVLERNSHFRLSLHYSGPLLEWLEANRPDFLPRLGALVSRGQVELLSGGFYEPLLPFIPSRDAVGQIELMNRYLAEKLNARPRGFWLAERVWNSFLPRTVAPTGLKYTLVDDSHLLYGGISGEEMFGYYVTEHEGSTLSIFPIHKRLRYAIPFRSPEETIEILRFYATDSEDGAITYADDGEKFGMWPGTYQWVFKEGWLEKFVAALEENRDWIRLLTFSEYLDNFPPRGRAYLPPATYEEMMEWALPPLSAAVYEDLLAELKREGRYEKYRPFLRGGSWENFLVKYSESNQIHKKMLYVSEKVHQALKEGSGEEGAPPAPALRFLWKGQGNCSYWHGLFGGLYHNFLRHGIYQNLIAAESLAERMLWGKEAYLRHEIVDLDKDLYPEVVITSPDLEAVLKPSYGGALLELDYRPKRFNLTNVLTRRPEAYHRKLKRGAVPSSPAGERPLSIHELNRVKEEKLEEALRYDWYNRHSFLDHFLGEDTTLEQFERGHYPELGDFVNQPYELLEAKERESSGRLSFLLHRCGHLWKREAKVAVEIFKRFLFHRQGAVMEVEYEIINRSPGQSDFWFGVEVNLTLLAGDHPQRYYLFPVPAADQRLKSRGSLIEVEWVRLRDEAVGMEVVIESAPPARLWRFPLETVSQSESGLEKTYQGSVLLFHWRFSLQPGEKKNLPVTLSVNSL